MPRLFADQIQTTPTQVTLSLAVLALVCWGSAWGQPGDGPPTYQRYRQMPSYDGGGHQPSGGFDHGNHHWNQDSHPSYQRDRRWDRKGGHRDTPQVSSGHFQRPYPYHLDYYRMRWGGSYAPYFGNLYGPPNVVLGVPPFYFGGGYMNGFNGGGYFNGGGGYFNGGAPMAPFEAAPMPVE